MLQCHDGRLGVATAVAIQQTGHNDNYSDLHHPQVACSIFRLYEEEYVNALEAIYAVIDMVPNWYLADTGPVHYDLECGGTRVDFWGHRPPTPWLTEFLRTVRRGLPAVISRLDPFPTTVAVDLLQEHFALEWLRVSAPAVNWQRVLDYSRQTLQRTYENAEIAFNLVIREAIGTELITEPSIQKILDPLGASLRTYFQVDRQCRYHSYHEIAWRDIYDGGEYEFAPEFLRPFTCILQQGEYSVHQTVRGDLIILNQDGLLAAKRKGRWKIYDVATLKNSITEAIGAYRVGANLFEICFDLSFRRHGALLVYDPEHRVLPHITNPESRVDDPGRGDLARRMFRDAVHDIAMGATERDARKKLRFLEIASVDGAVIFDDNNVLAFGAMIRTHPLTPGDVGARSTAAASAFLYGGIPIKISSDGESCIIFHSTDVNGRSARAKLEFL